MINTGIVIKNMNGYFYVQVPDGQVLECKVRGKLKKSRYSILVGDRVDVSEDGFVEAIHPRYNAMVRPAIANIDQVILVVAAREPDINELLFNRLLVMIEDSDIPLVICINKWDLADDRAKALVERYRNVGYEVITTSTFEGRGIDGLREHLAHKVTAFAGPSGVGKSSLLNAVDPKFQFQTGSVSNKIKRGRHTTRHATLFALDGDSFIMDTPGFSAVEFKNLSLERLTSLFPEFLNHESACQFSPCYHLHEPVCGVKKALEAGDISQERYEAYLAIRQEIQKELAKRHR